MLKKMQNDLQIMLTDPYAHVYCEKSYLCLLEKGESRELMTCMAAWRIKKLDGEIEFSQESIDRVNEWIIQGNHKQMAVELMRKPLTL